MKKVLMLVMAVAMIGCLAGCTGDTNSDISTTTTTTRSSYDYDYDYDYDDSYSYDPDDKYYSNNDYDNDGEINGEEFQGAVNDYMDDYFGGDSYDYDYDYDYDYYDSYGYDSNDSYYSSNDYNNDGELNGHEFQGAVNDYMDDYFSMY